MMEKTAVKGAKSKRYAMVDREHCAACGACEAVCPRGAISVWQGSFSVVDGALCVGCGRCSAECPASAISMEVRA
jgi:Pyruvate/2-oxoacid:ferredoxin oxidoreductase delta subunit